MYTHVQLLPIDINTRDVLTIVEKIDSMRPFRHEFHSLNWLDGTWQKLYNDKSKFDRNYISFLIKKITT